MKKYPILATNYDVSIWPLCMLGEMLVYYFHRVYGVRYPEEQIGEWKNRVNRWAADKNKHNRVASVVFARAMNDARWAWRMTKNVSLASHRLLQFSSSVFHANLSRKTDTQLWNLYARYQKEFIRMYAYAWFPNALEGIDTLFTKTLTAYVAKKVAREEVGKYVSVLTTPLRDSTRQKEEKAFLKIIQTIQKAKSASTLDDVSSAAHASLKRHCTQYCWLPFDYDGPAWDLVYFLDRARGLLRTRRNQGKMLLTLDRERAAIKKQQWEYEQKLDLRHDKKFSYLFALAREIMYLKDYRKDALFQSYYHMDTLVREIGRRLALSSIQVKHILPQEMRDVLVRRRYDPNILNERIQHSVLLYRKNGIRIFTGKDAKYIMQTRTEQKRASRVTSLAGDCAYAGRVQGVVRIVCSTHDIQKMRKGDILVSSATNPNLMPALQRAGAIVTDKGGLTCHAAIIARELKIPCIIGTKIATKVFHDGDRVEVDAEHGIIKKIS
ncbi:MAG: PEP-utilizing enzyme [bacterium]|nr:PEP-utilizing enzyme [bacterium]